MFAQEDRVPDAKTVWRFREHLKSAEALDELFGELSVQIEARGYNARKGQIVDASIVKAPGSATRGRRTSR